MLRGLIAILLCQVAGEVVVHLFDVQIPGPVVGMLVLFVVLQLTKPGPGAPVVRAAETLLDYLQLLFVPAGVGVIQYLSLVGASALPIVVGLLVSWFAALAVTAFVAVGLVRLGRMVR